MTLHTFPEHHARRPRAIRAAWRLDRRSANGGGHIAMALLGVMAGVLGAFIDLGNALVGGALGAAYPLVRTLWTTDTSERGAVLRSVLPLRRRDVVTARYLEIGLLYGLLFAAYLVVSLTVSRVTGTGLGGALFDTWMAAFVTTVAVLTAMPAAAIRGSFASFLAVLVAGFLAMFIGLAAWSVLADARYSVDTLATGVVAFTALALVIGIGGAVSRRVAVRHYERKDLR